MTLSSRTLLWAAAAVLGIVATATVAWAASQLAAPNIGLSSEPPSVVSGLAPASVSTPANPRGHAAAPRRGEPPDHPARHVATSPPAAAAPRAAAPLPVTPTRVTPTARATAPVPATTSNPSAPTSQRASTASPHRQATHHRDDSKGDGSGGPRTGRDD